TALIELGRCRDAVRDADQAIALDSTRADAWALRGCAHAFSGDTAATEKMMTDAGEALQRDPRFALGLAVRSAAFAWRGDFEIAITDARKAVEISPDLPWAHLALAEALYAGGKDGAESEASAAIRLAPSSAWGYVSRANIISASEPERAMDDLTRAILLAPAAVVPLAHRAALHLVAGRTQLAEADSDAAVKLDPENGGAFAARGFARVFMSRYVEANTDACEAIRLAPGGFMGYAVRAMALGNLKQPE